LNGGKITHVSSGDPEQATALIDDDLATAFEFAAVEKTHSIVLDMRDSFLVGKFTMIADSSRGTLQIFKLNRLPEDLVEAQRTNTPTVLSEEFLKNNKPAVQKVFKEKTNRIYITLPEFESRFVIIRWIHPEDKSFANASPPLFTENSPVGLRVYEIGFIGEIPEDFETLAYVPRAEFLSAGIPVGSDQTAIVGPALDPEIQADLDAPPTIPTLPVVSP